MDATSATEELILLTHAAYLRLKRDLKAAGLDLCYAAQAAQPIRLDWSDALFQDLKFLQQMQQRRPADTSYRLASVQHTKKGGWFRPDEFTLTFHAVSSVRDADLQQYLYDHQVQSSTETPKAMLG
jgi:hypothetical protein